VTAAPEEGKEIFAIMRERGCKARLGGWPELDFECTEYLPAYLDWGGRRKYLSHGKKRGDGARAGGGSHRGWLLGAVPGKKEKRKHV